MEPRTAERTASPRGRAPTRGRPKVAVKAKSGRSGTTTKTARKAKRAGKGPLSSWFLPAGVRRVLKAAAGPALLLGAAGLLIAIVSHDPLDPSFNRAIAGEPANWLGRPGSYGADLFLQAIGAGALLVVLVLGVWGARATFKRPLEPWGLRAVLAPVALLFAVMGLTGLAHEFPGLATGWPGGAAFGGFAGATLFGGIREVLAAAGVGLAPWLLTAIVWCLALAVLFPVLGVRWREYRAFGAAVARQIRRLRTRRQAALAARPAAARSDRRQPGDPGTGEPVKAPEDAEAPGRSTTGQAQPARPGDAQRPAGLVAERAPRPIPGKKAQAARQGRLNFGGAPFELPAVALLQAHADSRGQASLDDDALAENARYLESVLQDFGVKGEVVKVRPGPVVTLYELEPAPGVKSSRVIGLADDIARSMSAVSVRVAVIPGRNVIGIELPNAERETVYLRELLAADAFESSSGRLPLILGKTIGGSPVTADLAAMPHLLIAGTTGSGKSVGINTMILSLLYRLPPDLCKFIMIDPKMLELSIYDGIPHLLAPVVTEPKKAIVALRWAVREMESRYKLMSGLGVRSIGTFNKRIAEARAKGETLTHAVQVGVDDEGKPRYEKQPLDADPLPFIVIIVDEMADLMLVSGKEIEAAVQRLSQMARAAGIHLVMATQRPSVDVITGTIKANFPTRISFQVTSKIDSRTILGEQGAEQLLGQGDLLYMATGGRITRVHGPYVSDRDVEKVVAHLKSQGEPSYLEQVTEEDGSESDDPLGLGGGDDGDELYREAVAIVLQEGKASTSFIQRRLKIGYNRAARLIERMEREGIVSPANHAGKREILAGGA